MPVSMQGQTVQTTPFQDQKPGTSGLRKRVKVFQQKNYTENFVQATLDALGLDRLRGKTLVVGGDGRYFMKQAIQSIIRICAANGVAKIIVGQNGILSTPSVSNLIRKYHTAGAFILTASHNPGGPDNDFGIKFNTDNGGPAPESVTNKIFDISKKIEKYNIVDIPAVNLEQLGTSEPVANFTVEVIDSVDDYVKLMKSIFDFPLIIAFLRAHSDFKVLFDGMHGVTGPYGQRIFVKELGLPEHSVMNAIPKEDFGGGHPDPNLTYAHELVERVHRDKIHFGAASDGDGDRNMILGADAFVNPSDSVAVIAAHAVDAIPYFKSGLKGLARSMPTSAALDRVAKDKNLSVFETPTGWKFFGNLMDNEKLSICGEESFGTGSDHIREKDGLWAILAWLSIIASVNTKQNSAKLLGINDISQKHFNTYGRNFFSRYDYEEVESKKAEQMFKKLEAFTTTEKQSVVGKTFHGMVVANVDNFEYRDPIDNSHTVNQGYRILFQDSSRIIFRLSGTGSQGATVRLYVEKYSNDKNDYSKDPQESLKGLIETALTLTNLKESLGRDAPTVIT